MLCVFCSACANLRYFYPINPVDLRVLILHSGCVIARYFNTALQSEKDLSTLLVNIELDIPFES